jgi:GAF domain-containing protein
MVPMVVRDNVVGSLELIEHRKDREFTAIEISLCQMLANQAAVILENARLFAETQQSAQYSQALYETSRALSSHLEEEPLMRAILEVVYRTLGCEYANISIPDEKARTIGSRHIIWEGEFDAFPEWIQMAQYPLDHPDITADVYRSGRTEIIGEWDERFNREIWDQFEHERFLRIFMPIKMRDHVLGVIEVAYDKREKASINEDEVQLLAAFMDQAALALQNARLFEETQSRARRERILREITTRVRGSSDPDTIMRTAVRELGTALGRPAFVRLGEVEELRPGSTQTDHRGNASVLAPDGDGRDVTQEGGE